MNNKLINTFAALCSVVVLLAGYNISAQTPRFVGTNRQVQTVLTRIETNTDIYRRDMKSAVSNSSINNTPRGERIMDLIDSFERSTDIMRSAFDSRGVISNEITDMLSTGSMIDRFMTRNRVTGRAATRWARIKTDLNLIARYYSVTWNTTQTDPYEPAVSVYTGTDTQLRNLIAQIENKTDTYKREMERSLDQSTLDNTNTEDSWNAYISRFEEATNRLRTRFESRQSTVADASEVLNRARVIDQFMVSSRLQRNVEAQWSSLRNDLNTLAGYYRVSWNWNQVEPSIAYTGTDAQLRALIAQIENKTDVYKRQMERSLDQSTINNTDTEDSWNAYISKFEEATNRLRDQFNSRRSSNADATEVLTRARYIDQFMARSRMNRGAEMQWASIRTDLNTLATYYRVSWDWNLQNPGYPTGPGTTVGGGRFDSRITGTYQLNASRSDNVATVIDRAIGTVTVDQRDRTRRSLERRLASPQIIAITMNGRTVSMGSS
ncbi:MAG: hypothetical protein ABIV21_04750, partial [Pyrinomonadaceae bacterium]